METIRFAPIIRVSTEQQEQKGESLRTQKQQIADYVTSLGGIIPERCWQYSGQEHATPDQERVKLDQLLKDASLDLFDAVIVCDASRWSRDNLRSKAGLEMLRNNGVRFFVGTMEYDLFAPTAKLFLGMSAEIGEFQAHQQALKSIQNRINRAKRGIPTAGKIPYGRTYSEKEGWGIDKEKQLIIQQAAKRYLSGETMPDLSAAYRMNNSNLWKILTKRSGDTWECSFVNKTVNISETVTIKVPRLLNEETIKAVHEKSAANKTYTHGHIKHNYLLARMIFHEPCGYSLSGYINHSGRKYYRKPNAKTSCTLNKMVQAGKLDRAVLLLLAETFGDIQKLKKAINKATPDLQQVQDLQKEKSQLKQDLIKTERQRDNLITAVSEGLLSAKEIEARISKIRRSEEAINDRITTIESKIVSMPDPQEVEKKLGMFEGKILYANSRKNPEWILKKDFQWQRQFVQAAFAGKDSNGNRYGVYADYTNGQWKFTLHGAFGETIIQFNKDNTNFTSYLLDRAPLLCHFP